MTPVTRISLLLILFPFSLMAVTTQPDSISNTPVKFTLAYDSIQFNSPDSQAANSAYSFWSEKWVNPYHIDVLKKTDTTLLILADSVSGFSFPTDSLKINSDFGLRHGRFHYGVDLDLETGDPVYAAFDGVIRLASYNGAYGRCMVLVHDNGFETVYGHLSAYLASPGDRVKAGDKIGLGGRTGRATGSHLHFEIRFMGQPLDPHKIVDFTTGKLVTDTFYLCKKSFDYLIELRKIKYYTVRPGDSLWKISNRYGVSVTRLCQLNHISRNTVLQIGWRLRYQ